MDRSAPRSGGSGPVHLDAHADDLIAFFRTVIATASRRCGRSVATTGVTRSRSAKAHPMGPLLRRDARRRRRADRIRPRERIDQAPQRRGVFGMRPTATADHSRSEGDPLRRVLRVPLAGDGPVRTPAAFVIDVANIGIRADGKRGQLAQLPQRRGDNWRAAQLTKIAAGPSGLTRATASCSVSPLSKRTGSPRPGTAQTNPTVAGRPVSMAARSAISASAAVGIVSTMIRSTPAAARLPACARCSASATSGGVSKVGR